MDRENSKYFLTARCMDEALLALLDKKDFEFITVKELCEKAGVNRSTFYLHYDSMNDLLSETNEYIMGLVYSYYPERSLSSTDIMTMSKDDLVFISPEYLVPFLRFIKDHQKLFRTILEQNQTLKGEKNLEALFNKHFKLIYDRFSLEEEKGHYITMFIVSGFMGVVSLWLRNGCRENEEELAKLVSDFIPKHNEKIS